MIKNFFIKNFNITEGAFNIRIGIKQSISDKSHNFF